MKTSELSNTQLDYLCAKAQWRQPHKAQMYFRKRSSSKARVIVTEKWRKRACDILYTPSTNGQQAMDLVKAFKVRVRPDKGWGAALYFEDGRSEWWFGPTPELAITRAVVASKWGDVVDDELLGETVGEDGKL